MMTSRRANVGVLAGISLLCLAMLRLLGDQVEMQNGDRYAGKILSLNSNMVVLESSLLGTVRLPRGQVARVSFGTETNHIALLAAQTEVPGGPASIVASNASPSVSPDLRQLSANSNLMQQVQQQLLGDAGPEATAKYNELLGGLMTGRLTEKDIRVEAAKAADQVRALKRDLGNDAGGELDGYLAILEHFLNEPAAPGGAATNSPVPPPSPAPAPKP